MKPSDAWLKLSPSVQDYVAVSAGAVGGALARHWISQRAAPYKPWGIAGINIIGSFVLGALSASAPLPPRLRLLIGTGFCGSFTTFSTFSVDTLEMIQNGRSHAALAYVVLNNLGGLAAAGSGYWIFSRSKRLKN